uniref:Secreted peptide n=1 Tax=Rhipicephalus pulchellus TaxID=72859 RepID=L7LZU0_RHIPC
MPLCIFYIFVLFLVFFEAENNIFLKQVVSEHAPQDKPLLCTPCFKSISLKKKKKRSFCTKAKMLVWSQLYIGNCRITFCMPDFSAKAIRRRCVHFYSHLRFRAHLFRQF